jgi:ATPase family associated with various cellular activities (AAA)
MTAAQATPIEGVPLVTAVDLRRIAAISARAVTQLWDPEIGAFWRSTEHRSRGLTSDGPFFFPTVTFVSTEALARMISSYPDLAHDSDRDRLIDSYLRAIPHAPQEIRSTLDPDFANTNKLNPFTVARCMSALASAERVALASRSDWIVDRDRISVLLSDLVGPQGFLAAVQSKGTAAHPYVVFHVIRACEGVKGLGFNEFFAATDELVTSLQGYLATTADALLASSTKAPLSPGDVIALAFCGAAFVLTQSPQYSAYKLPIVETLFASQDASGCWPFGRVVAPNKDITPERLEISTYEIAWIAAEILRSVMLDKRLPITAGRVEAMIQAAARSAQYSLGDIVRLAGSPGEGWCSDYPFGRPLIESWTSATVLQMALSLIDLFETVESTRSLATFSVDYIDEPPHWLEWPRFESDSDPDDGAQILVYIRKRILETIASSPRQLPSPEAHNVSLLLFGPPGTSKTTIVKAMASYLRWPMVTLSPGEFIARGLEYIEAEAQSVFARLEALTRAVVLFDECDELFRDRQPKSSTEQTRGIAAFVTASMLPKLQRLHDRGRILFVICTNSFQSMDKAVTRPGRIDHIVAVGPPSRTARIKILTELLTRPGAPRLNDGLVEVIAGATERFNRTELARLVDDILLAPWSRDEQATGNIVSLAERWAGSLAITPDSYSEYILARSASSYAHIAQGGVR